MSRVLIDGTVWRQGRRKPSLYMDVRFLACPSDEYTARYPLCNYYNLNQY